MSQGDLSSSFKVHAVFLFLYSYCSVPSVQDNFQIVFFLLWWWWFSVVVIVCFCRVNRIACSLNSYSSISELF